MEEKPLAKQHLCMAEAPARLSWPSGRARSIQLHLPKASSPIKVQPASPQRATGRARAFAKGMASGFLQPRISRWRNHIHNLSRNESTGSGPPQDYSAQKYLVNRHPHKPSEPRTYTGGVPQSECRNASARAAKQQDNHPKWYG